VVAALVLTVKVDVPEPPATEVGTKLQVGARFTTGVTAHVRFTALLKPFTGAIVTVEVAVPPAATEAGESAVAVTVKSGTGAAVTVKPTVVLWLNNPEVPVRVTLDVPTGVAEVVLMVRAESTADAPGVTGVGTKAQVAPVGKVKGSQVSATALLKPLRAATVTVYEAGLPAATVRVAGSALTVKSGGGGGASLKATDCMTQSPLGSAAVASQLPATDVIWCWALSPLG